MSKLPHRRPLYKDILPAAASFTVTLAAGLAVSFFQLTGGFPDARQDRPALVADEMVDAESADTALFAEVEEAPSDVPVVEEASADADADAPAYEAHPAPPPQLTIDTESVDSILATHARAALADYDRGPIRLSGGPTQSAAETTAAPSEINLDLLTLPQTGDVD